MGRQERVLLLGARLDIAPIAHEDVLAGFNQPPRAGDGSLVERVRGHPGIVTELDGKTADMTSKARDTGEVLHTDLGDGNTMPRLGFGVFQVAPEETVEAVGHALRTGYRAVDTAMAYGNEREVGEAIGGSEVGREDVFVTTKLWNAHHGSRSAHRAFDQSLDRLGFDYLDLYLIHWPAPGRGLYVETWEALVELDSGRVRSIGVSNFEIEHLERIIDATGVVPAVNQVELHPRLQQAELRRFHAEHGIVTEAWSPIAKGRVLDDPVITRLASSYRKTPAQIVLRWHLQLGNVVIPKSARPERIDENFQIFDFTLDDEAMGNIEALDAGERMGPHPATFNG